MSSIRRRICGCRRLRCSAPRRAAAAAALRLADRHGDRLVMVHVIPPRPPMTAPSVPIGAHSVGIANVREVNRIEAETAFASVEPDVAAASADRVIQHGDAALRLAALGV